MKTITLVLAFMLGWLLVNLYNSTEALKHMHSAMEPINAAVAKCEKDAGKKCRIVYTAVVKE